MELVASSRIMISEFESTRAGDGNQLLLTCRQAFSLFSNLKPVAARQFGDETVCTGDSRRLLDLIVGRLPGFP